MKRIRTLATLAGLAIVGTLGLAAPASAAPAGAASIGQDRSAVLAAVTAAMAGAPAELRVEPDALADLPTDVLFALPVRYELTGAPIRRVPLEQLGASAPLAVGVSACYQRGPFAVTGYNTFGHRLWSFTSEIGWCGDAANGVTGIYHYNAWGATHFPGWSWQGVQSSWTSYGPDNGFVRRGSQGKFCFIDHLSCVQETWPRIEHLAWWNGNHSASS